MSTEAPLQSLDAAAAEYPQIQLFIDGEWTDGTSGASEDVYNPATGSVLGTVPHASTGRSRPRARSAAERGFKVWSAKTTRRARRDPAPCRGADPRARGPRSPAR